MHRPDPSEFASSYANYVALVPEDDILTAMRSDLSEVVSFLSGVPEAEACRRHPPYTWSVKEVVGHVTDAERIFGYRALRFARSDTTPLPGFDENAYAQVAGFDRQPLRDLVAEFDFVRRSHLALFEHLDDVAWTRGGTANGQGISVRALAYIIVGHQRHHVAILRRRLSQA
jgi:hypothetical protein